MQPVQFGVELEFVGPGVKFCRHLLEKRFRILRPSRRARRAATATWTLGTDLSVFHNDRQHNYIHEDRFAMEIRTPIMQPRELPKMERVLDLFKNFAFITRSCGMHVHISCPDGSPRWTCLDANGIAREMWERYGGSQIWRMRRQYCRQGTTMDPNTYNKYKVVNIIDGANGHIEIRLFNGTMEYSEVYPRVIDVIDCYRRHLQFGRLDGYGRPYGQPRRTRVETPAAIREATEIASAQMDEAARRVRESDRVPVMASVTTNSARRVRSGAWGEDDIDTW